MSKSNSWRQHGQMALVQDGFNRVREGRRCRGHKRDEVVGSIVEHLEKAFCFAQWFMSGGGHGEFNGTAPGDGACGVHCKVLKVFFGRIAADAPRGEKGRYGDFILHSSKSVQIRQIMRVFFIVLQEGLPKDLHIGLRPY